MAVMRLDRFFSSQGILSRKEIRPVVKRGGIIVNGIPAASPDQKVDSERDIIALDGREVSYRPYVYLMLNKPQGYVSSTDDKHNPTVLDLVPTELWREGLFPAGRLDRDTLGFVLLTNDGGFAHEILSPKKHVPKTYLVRLDGAIHPEGISQLEAGVTLVDGSVCQGASIQVLEEGDEPLVQIVLREGKYHQIKRMFGVIGLGVNWLKRTQIGGLALDEQLPEGGCREILHKELDKILSL